MPDAVDLSSIDYDRLLAEAMAEDWTPPFFLLSKDDRQQLTKDEQRSRARNRIGIYELHCADCGRAGLVQVRRDDDGEVWRCPDCKGQS